MKNLKLTSSDYALIVGFFFCCIGVSLLALSVAMETVTK